MLVGGREAHPELTETLRPVEELPNVHFLSEKGSAETLKYPQHFDVCTMPYRIMPYTQYVYPLKLHEYRPIVGIPIRSLLSFSDVVALAAAAEE